MLLAVAVSEQCEPMRRASLWGWSCRSTLSRVQQQHMSRHTCLQIKTCAASGPPAVHFPPPTPHPPLWNNSHLVLCVFTQARGHCQHLQLPEQGASRSSLLCANFFAKYTLSCLKKPFAESFRPKNGPPMYRVNNGLAHSSGSAPDKLFAKKLPSQTAAPL